MSTGSVEVGVRWALVRYFGGHVVDSVVGVTQARQCGVRAGQTEIFGGEDCRETMVTELADGDQVAVT